MYNRFKHFLSELAPYVVVVGSYGRMKETPISDLDCYLRSRPREEVNPEDVNSETYMPEVIELCKKYSYETCSVLVGHIAIEQQVGAPIMVEVSSHYRIPSKNPIHVRELFGVNFLCAEDRKDTPLEDCYEFQEWSDEKCDMVTYNPLPEYVEATL